SSRHPASGRFLQSPQARRHEPQLLLLRGQLLLEPGHVRDGRVPQHAEVVQPREELLLLGQELGVALGLRVFGILKCLRVVPDGASSRLEKRRKDVADGPPT
ncbi:unnamed protein product, partial [Ectocarpus fasciculatus]